MRTCWVLDHPAHVRLMLPLLQKSGTRDLIIASNRAEIRQLLATAEGLLPTRELHWVERPVGRYKIVKAWMRIRKVKAIFRRAAKNNMPVKRVVGVGAPLELIAHQTLRHHRHSSFERWYITDTEVNHVAHRLAKKAATDVVVPTHWDASLDGSFITQWSGRLHRLNGLHGHIHLTPQLKSRTIRHPPALLVRRLQGDGIHDSDEMLPLDEETWADCDVTFVDEFNGIDEPWKLDSMLSSADGVITQSVTMASEAVILGTPTLLVSKAQRGFLDRLEREGAPLFRWQSECKGDAWEDVKAQFFAGLHLTDALEEMEWPDVKEAFVNLFFDSSPMQNTLHQ